MDKKQREKHPNTLWQEERLKPQGERLPGASLIRCYGPNGDFSMLLPSAKVDRKTVFVDGKAQVEVSSSCLEIPHIRELHRRVLDTGMATSMRIVFADACLAEYSAALLATQYNLSDDDLTMLHSGSKWQESLIIHALGGPAEIEGLRRINPVDVIVSSVDTQRRITDAMIGNPRTIEAVGEPMADVGGDSGDDFDIAQD